MNFGNSAMFSIKAGIMFFILEQLCYNISYYIVYHGSGLYGFDCKAKENN